MTEAFGYTLIAAAGAVYLHSRGLLELSASLLEAQVSLLQELPLVCVPLQHRLLDHLRGSAAAASLARIAAAAEDIEAYIHSTAAANLLSALGSLFLVWGRNDPAAVWAGGFLRESVGWDTAYFLISRLMLQQQVLVLQKQHITYQDIAQQEDRAQKGFMLTPEILEAIAVEACSNVG